MNGYRTIVVACDDSAEAVDAVTLAERLRDPDDGRLVLTNVFPFYRGWALSVFPSVYASVLQAKAESSVEEISDALDPAVPRTLRAVSDSSVPRAIDDVATAEGADLIVLGATHRGVTGRLAGRTTMQRLLHGAPCAVAVAPPGGVVAARLRCIGVAFDGSEESRAALATALALAAREGASVRVVRAAEILEFGPTWLASTDDLRFREAVQSSTVRELEEAVASAPDDIEVEGRVVHGWAAGSVLEACADADLIVCGSRSYGPLHRVLAGSTSLAIAAHAEIPVLVLPRGAVPEPSRTAAPDAGSSVGA